ncbi:MAG: helix-turn-helix domain-containing protein [Chitinophagaceae bacterium]|nr:MAG: helix-turn-helix domain-containing protein [Chitinophagaceae bacterium]
MPAKSLEAFYAQKFDNTSLPPAAGTGEFNVFRLADMNSSTGPAPYVRYDFFKIMLIHGRHRCHYPDKSISINGNTILFFNPTVPYRFEGVDATDSGYVCLFKEPFFTQTLRTPIHDLPVFRAGAKPAYQLNPAQDNEVAALFEKMLAEMNSDYHFKHELLHSYVSELIYLVMKLEPIEELYRHPDSNARITSIFTALLDRQFPIESPKQFIKLRSAVDFADKLSVHVNHLNRAVRLTTGKTTTTLIAERLTNEARALLKHTDWNISEISSCLGFEQPSHFTRFFKKQTGSPPTAARLV